MRLVFSERHALEFASNRVRFTIEMQLAVRMKLLLPLLLFGLAADGAAHPEFVHVHSGGTARIGLCYEIFYRGRFNAYRKPVDPQAAHCAGKA